MGEMMTINVAFMDLYVASNKKAIYRCSSMGTWKLLGHGSEKKNLRRLQQITLYLRDDVIRRMHTPKLQELYDAKIRLIKPISLMWGQ